MAFDLSRAGYDKKMAALKTLVHFFEEAPLDAVTYLQEGCVSSVINGQYVGVISGNLKRSIEIVPTSKFSAAVVSDLGIAPYSKEVRDRTTVKYGRDFYALTQEIFGAELQNSLLSEWRRAIKSIQLGNGYRYQSQLPII